MRRAGLRGFTNSPRKRGRPAARRLRRGQGLRRRLGRDRAGQQPAQPAHRQRQTTQAVPRGAVEPAADKLPRVPLVPGRRTAPGCPAGGPGRPQRPDGDPRRDRGAARVAPVFPDPRPGRGVQCRRPGAAHGAHHLHDPRHRGAGIRARPGLPEPARPVRRVKGDPGSRSGPRRLRRHVRADARLRTVRRARESPVRPLPLAGRRLSDSTDKPVCQGAIRYRRRLVHG